MASRGMGKHDLHVNGSPPGRTTGLEHYCWSKSRDRFLATQGGETGDGGRAGMGTSGVVEVGVGGGTLTGVI